MTGVEILATQEVATAFGFDWGMFGAIGFLIGVLLALIFWALSDNYCIGEKATIFMVCLGLALGFVFGGFIASISKTGTPTAYETYYKVTISDEVSMNDFLERYVIISQEGKIYTVRERDGK